MYSGFLVPLVYFAAWGAADAGQSEDSTIRVFQDCKELENDYVRLQCYDSIADGKTFQRPSVPKLSKLPDTVEGKEKAERVVTAQYEKPRKPALKSGTFTVIKIRNGPRGHIRFYLENGDVWDQKSATRFHVGKLPAQVKIKKKTFGGYLLIAKGRSTEVKRLR